LAKQAAVHQGLGKIRGGFSLDYDGAVDAVIANRKALDFDDRYAFSNSAITPEGRSRSSTTISTV
jgi:hypothetical protein